VKKILVTGADSYVGTAFERWFSQYPDEYSVDTIDMRDNVWQDKPFEGYDVVLHVAAVVHKKESPKIESMYLKVNVDLPVAVAKKARAAGVRQFIFMSTMAVYGEEGEIGHEVIITRDTTPNPKTYYGKSKLAAEYELNKLANENFKILVLRPPMIYGSNCPGNYAKLVKLAKLTPIFPMIENKRCMLYIGKLCQHLKRHIDKESKELFFPQDNEHWNASLLVKKLAEQSGKKIYLSESMGWLIRLIGARLGVIKKVFGNLVYEREEVENG